MTVPAIDKRSLRVIDDAIAQLVLEWRAAIRAASDLERSGRVLMSPTRQAEHRRRLQEARQKRAAARAALEVALEDDA